MIKITLITAEMYHNKTDNWIAISMLLSLCAITVLFLITFPLTFICPGGNN